MPESFLGDQAAQKDTAVFYRSFDQITGTAAICYVFNGRGIKAVLSFGLKFFWIKHIPLLGGIKEKDSFLRV